MIRGIDVSHWQSQTPSLSGLDFLMARATYALIPDDMFLTHRKNARTAGVVFGAYHFGVGAKQASIASQAAAFIRYAFTADLLFLDLETQGSIGPSMSTAEARLFIQLVKAQDPLHRKVGLYHSESGFPSVGQDFNWPARWGSTPPSGHWTFWQYRGSPLDLDYYNGTRAQLNAYIGVTAPAPAPPIPIPEPPPLPVPPPMPVPPPDPLPPDPLPAQSTAGPVFIFWSILRRLIGWEDRPIPE